jgi:outer membrane lipoprotein-sorting protein
MDRKWIRRLVVVTLILVGAAGGAFAQAKPDFHSMLQKVDDLNNFTTDFSAVFTIVAEKPGQDPSVTKAQIFRRDPKKQFLIIILQPETQKGQGYLQVDNNLWFYDPQSRQFSHSSLKENFQSSDAKNSDFNQQSLAQDYTVDGSTEGTLGVYPVYILDLKAKNNEVTYPHMKLWIRRDLQIVLKAEDYSLSGRLMRTAYYPNYVKVGDKYFPSRMLYIDNLNPGNKTQITVTDPSVASLPDYLFTKAYLERVNR